MKLPKKAVKGGRISARMRVQDTSLGAAAVQAADNGGAAPRDEYERLHVRGVRAVRLWSAHSAWSLCLARWSSAFALEAAARTPREKAMARGELFAAHRLVGPCFVYSFIETGSVWTLDSICRALANS